MFRLIQNIARLLYNVKTTKKYIKEKETRVQMVIKKVGSETELWPSNLHNQVQGVVKLYTGEA